MKHKLSKILGIGLTLALLASMLVMGVPVAADSPVDTDVGFEFGVDEAADTAQWAKIVDVAGTVESTLPVGGLGNYSVELYEDMNSPGNSYVQFVPPSEITISDLEALTNEWGYWYHIAITDPLVHNGPYFELKFTSGTDYVDITVMTQGTDIVFDEWTQVELTSSIALVNYWGSVGGVGVSYDGGTLAEAITAVLLEDGISDDWELTNVRVQIVTPVAAARTCYIDDVTIDGTTYELEPIFLDKAYYSVGDTVEVTVPNFAANTDPIRKNPVTGEPDPTTPLNSWSVSVTSDSDSLGTTVELEETGANTGVFTASFTTVGTLPAAEDEIYVQDGDDITVEYNTTGTTVGWGTGADEVTTITAKVDDTAPAIDEDLTVGEKPVTPTDGAIIYSTEPNIVATYEDLTSGIDESSVRMTVDGAIVTLIPENVTQTDVSYSPDEGAFDPGDTVEVTVDVKDKAGNAAETASWSFTIASALNVTVFPTTYIAGNEDNLVVTITGVTGAGPDGAGSNALNWAKVVVSAPVGQSLATGEWDGTTNLELLVDATYDDGKTIIFEELLPNDASSDITVTVTGLLDPVGGAEEGEAVGPVILTIPVSGFIVTDITPSTFQIIDSTSDISVTVTTKAGEPVSASLVTITAALADGFEKDVTGDGDLDSFTEITINGLTDEIKYDNVNAEPCSVTGGVYQVTDITFAKLGGVTITVGEADSPRAKFDPAFSVRGVDAYDVLLDPDTVTAGVATEVVVTVTEDGDPVTAIDSIELDSAVLQGTDTSEIGEYTITVSESEAGTPAVTVTGEGGQKYGTADLAIGLPTVDYTIYETVGEEEVERNVMLVGDDYTLDVTVDDALGDPLDGFLWIGTYDEEAEAFTSVADVTVVTDGMVEDFAVTAPALADSLVWMIGSSESLDETQALVPTPPIVVEDFYYDLNPTEATVDVATTYTVTDNYGNPAGDRDVKIVTPAIETITKTTGPAGTPLAGKFIYTAPEAGDYYVSVKLDNESWQDAITVTVLSEVGVTLESISASPESVTLAVDGTQQLIVTAAYSDGTTPVVTAEANYESSNALVATVSEAGLITGVAEGDATITVSYETETDTVSVTVSPAAKGDFDGDGHIGLADFVDFAAAYGSSTDDPNYNAIGDFDGDGNIGLADFVEFAAVYGS